MGKDMVPHEAEFLFYTGPGGKLRIEVFYAGETVWLTQKRMAELFDVSTKTINEHLQNIYGSGELDAQRTIRKFRIVQTEGEREVEREVNFYNLDVIISVGYRVNSIQATRFRVWATQTLKEFLIKGFVLDDERLKNGTHFGKDYFDELLERIREIRASERRFYQKITDIYVTSVDYDSQAEITQEFYATVQNKLHFAIHGHTAAELIAARADAKKPHMGLKTWKNAPAGKVQKSDVDTAKNYLNEKELRQLNRIVSMYLDFAENQAERSQPMKMLDWIDKLNGFLQFNELDLLQNPGKVSATAARKLAEKQFSTFRLAQDGVFESDFDKQVKKLDTPRKDKES